MFSILQLGLVIFVDADCGRGFTRIENYCVNISNEMAAPNDSPTITSRCQAIQAGQLQAPTQAMLFLLKVFLYVFSRNPFLCVTLTWCRAVVVNVTPLPFQQYSPPKEYCIPLA